MKKSVITSLDEIEFEFVYNTNKEESEQAMQEVIEIISREGCKKGYFGTSL